MKISKVRDVKTPTRGTAKSAGIDFYIPNYEAPFKVYPGDDVLIPSGIKAAIPPGHMLMAANKSGVSTSRYACLGAGLTPKDKAFESIVILGAEIVDEDYQGEIFIHLVNVGNHKVELEPGMKIAQFILVPIVYEDVEEVAEDQLFEGGSERGSGALGSTGSY